MRGGGPPPRARKRVTGNDCLSPPPKKVSTWRVVVDVVEHHRIRALWLEEIVHALPQVLVQRVGAADDEVLGAAGLGVEAALPVCLSRVFCVLVFCFVCTGGRGWRRRRGCAHTHTTRRVRNMRRAAHVTPTNKTRAPKLPDHAHDGVADRAGLGDRQHGVEALEVGKGEERCRQHVAVEEVGCDGAPQILGDLLRSDVLVAVAGDVTIMGACWEGWKRSKQAGESVLARREARQQIGGRRATASTLTTGRTCRRCCTPPHPCSHRCLVFFCLCVCVCVSGGCAFAGARVCTCARRPPPSAGKKKSAARRPRHQNKTMARRHHPK